MRSAVPRLEEIVMDRWWTWIVAAASVVVAGWLSYIVTFEMVARRVGTDFSSRAELENWALPHLAAEGPAAVAAVCMAVLVAAGWTVRWGVRTATSH